MGPRTYKLDVEYLRQRRAGLAHEAFAHDLEIAPGTLTKAMHSQDGVRADTVRKFATSLRCSVLDLLTLDAFRTFRQHYPHDALLIRPPEPAGATPSSARRTPSAFVGRRAVRAHIQAILAATQAVQIVGETKSGRSSVLEWTRRQITDRPVVHIAGRTHKQATPAALLNAILAQLPAAPTPHPTTTDEAMGALDDLSPFALLVDDADYLYDRNPDLSDVSHKIHGLITSGTLQWISTSREDISAQANNIRRPSQMLTTSAVIPVGAFTDKEAEYYLCCHRVPPTETPGMITIAGRNPAALAWMVQAQTRVWTPHERAAAFSEQFNAVYTRWFNAHPPICQDALRRVARERPAAAELDAPLPILLDRLALRGLVARRNDRYTAEGSVWTAFLLQR